MNWPTNLFYQECLKTVKKYKEEHSYNLTFWTSFKSRWQPITSVIITPGTFCRGKNGELPFHFNGIPTRILRADTRSCEWKGFPVFCFANEVPPSGHLPLALNGTFRRQNRRWFISHLHSFSFCILLCDSFFHCLLICFERGRGPTLPPLKKIYSDKSGHLIS